MEDPGESTRAGTVRTVGVVPVGEERRTALLLPQEPPESEGSAQHGDGAPHHRYHLGLFLGAGVERRREGEEASGNALGLDLTYRLDERWGVGGTLETLGNDTEREAVLFMPVSCYLTESLHVLAAPGWEIGRRKDRAALRLGAGYAFELPGGWTLGPDFALDLMDGGRRTWGGGLTLGRHF